MLTPAIKGQREQENGWGALTQVFTQLVFQPCDTGNIHHRAEKVKEAPNASANPKGLNAFSIAGQDTGRLLLVPRVLKRLRFLVRMHWGKQDWWPSVETMLQHRFCITHKRKTEKTENMQILLSLFSFNKASLSSSSSSSPVFISSEGGYNERTKHHWMNFVFKEKFYTLCLSLKCVLEWKAWHDPTWELKIPHSLLNTSNKF